MTRMDSSGRTAKSGRQETDFRIAENYRRSPRGPPARETTRAARSRWKTLPPAFFLRPETWPKRKLLLADLPGPYVAIHPGSGSESENWPLERWLLVQRRLLDRSGVGHFLIVGGESDSRQLCSMKRANRGATDGSGKPSLPMLGAILSQCALFVGHDSGISHLAAATPGFLVYCSSAPQTPKFGRRQMKKWLCFSRQTACFQVWKPTSFSQELRKCSPMSPETIVAVDPALRVAGYAVLTRDKLKLSCSDSYGSFERLSRYASGCLLALHEEL